MLKEAIVKEHYEGLGIKDTIALCSGVGEYSRGNLLKKDAEEKHPYLEVAKKLILRLLKKNSSM